MFSIVSVWLVKYAIETHSYLFKKLFWRQNQKGLVSLLPPHLRHGNILLKPLYLLTSVLPHWQIPDNFLSSPIPLLFLCTFLTLQDYQCSSKLAGMSTQHKVLTGKWSPGLSCSLARSAGCCTWVLRAGLFNALNYITGNISQRS